MKEIEVKVDRRWSDMFDWHVALGCTRCSQACSHCASARWLGSLHKPKYDALLERIRDTGAISSLLGESRRVPVFNGSVKLQPWKLRQPLFLPDGSQVFVSGCSDLFHKSVPFEYVDKVFTVVEACPSMVFFVITRRPDRAVEFSGSRRWPANLWVGTSAENQSCFDRRVSLLGKIPARFRGVSVKPMLGAVDITKLAGAFEFVIVGGQSGLGGLPLYPDWVRRVRDDCVKLDVAFQFHQWGAWSTECGDSCSGEIWMDSDGVPNLDGRGMLFHRVGSKCSGRVIDGEEWDEYPDTRMSVGIASDS